MRKSELLETDRKKKEEEAYHQLSKELAAKKDEVVLDTTRNKRNRVPIPRRPNVKEKTNEDTGHLS